MCGVSGWGFEGSACRSSDLMGFIGIFSYWLRLLFTGWPTRIDFYKGFSYCLPLFPPTRPMRIENFSGFLQSTCYV